MILHRGIFMILDTVLEIIFIISIIVSIIYAVVCAAIASGKNRSAVGWFFGGLTLGLIALIMIIALGDKDY